MSIGAFYGVASLARVRPSVSAAKALGGGSGRPFDEVESSP
jgi:hypothetical protein